jgi:hypothetical protein
MALWIGSHSLVAQIPLSEHLNDVWHKLCWVAGAGFLAPASTYDATLAVIFRKYGRFFGWPQDSASEPDIGRSVPNHDSTVSGLQRTNERGRSCFRVQSVPTDIDLLSGGKRLRTLA